MPSCGAARQPRIPAGKSRPAAAAGARAVSGLVLLLSQPVCAVGVTAPGTAVPMCSGVARPAPHGAAVPGARRDGLDSSGTAHRHTMGIEEKHSGTDRHTHDCLHSWSLGVRTARCLLPELECKHQVFLGGRGGVLVNLVGFFLFVL